MNETIAKLYSKCGYDAREKVTTFAKSDAKVVETFITNKDPKLMKSVIPYSKQVFLPSTSPLRAAGVDSFYLSTRRSGKRYLHMLDNKGGYLTKTGLAEEVRAAIKAIKRFGFKF